MEHYADIKVGDEVVVFTYWNSKPSETGEVTGVTEHFVEIQGPKGRFGSRKKQLISRSNIEVITRVAPHPHKKDE